MAGIVLLNYEFNRSELLDYIDTFTVQLGVYIGLIIFGGLPMLIYFLIRKKWLGKLYIRI